ncbi:MAG: hypothetical protein R2854_04115 [Caldilineaceae bacterium]
MPEQFADRTHATGQQYRGYPGGQPYGRAAAGASGYDSAYAYGDYRYVSDGGRVGGEDETGPGNGPQCTGQGDGRGRDRA